VRGFLAKKLLFLVQEYGEGERVFMPNNPVELGAGFSINNTVLSFGYGYGFDFMRDKEYGKTKSFDFQFHNYGRKHAFDFFFQQYKGFYMEDDKMDAEFVLCPDLEIKKYGVYGEYIFNNKKFSYKAAFDYSEKQLRSAGSFLIGGGIYYTDIKSDSSFFHNEKNTLKNFQFGISAGYAYTWVINRRFFLGGSASTGINFGNESFSRIGKDKLEVYPSISARVSAGYNKVDWSLGFSYVQNFIFPSFVENESIGLSSGHFQLTYVRRFDSSPILSNVINKISPP